MSTVAIPHDIEPHPMTRMYNGKFGLWLFLASEVMLFGALFSTYVLLRIGAPEGTWPKGDEILNVPLATLNTMVLISSSVTMVFAWASFKLNNVARGRLFLIITFLLAGAFLVVKYFEYSAKFHHHEVFLKQAMDFDGEMKTSIAGHLEGQHVEGEDVTIVPDDRKLASGDVMSFEAITIASDNIKRVSNFGPQHSAFMAIYFTLTGLHGLHIVGGMIVILFFAGPGIAMWKKIPEKYSNRIECTGLYWHFVDLVWIFLFPVLYLL